MATGGLDNASVPDYDECPVCRECLKDPRTFNCAHYFCTVCIEGLVRENPQGPIKCPTCREVTQLPEGSGVSDLPRHEGKYSFHDQVTDFLSQAKRQVTRSCDVCRDKKVTATCHCFRCRKNLCGDCMKQHDKRAPTHETVPMSDDIFCPSHVNEVVLELCKDCKRGICGDCFFEGHEDHQTVDIKHVAQEGRLRLQEFLKIQSASDNDDVTLKRIQSHLEEARKLDTEFCDSISQTRKLIKELEAKIDQVERVTKAKLAVGIKTLCLYEADIKDKMTSRQSLVDHATYLVNKASDQELVKQENNFPINKVNVLQNIADACVEMPVLDKPFLSLATQLQQMVSDCEMKLVNKKIGTFRNMEDLKKQNTVAVGHNVGGITMDNARQRVVVRTDDASGPLKVYDYQGQLQESLGAGVNGLADCTNWRSICIDAKRNYYVAPWQSELILVNRAGQLVKSIPAGGLYNCGVAYHKEGDCYLVSDFKTHTVYVIDPNTSQVTRQIRSKGSVPTQFNKPYDVDVGYVAGIATPCVIVSNLGNHSLKLLDLNGLHVQTFGSHGQGNNQLSSPVGVTTDPRGRVIVCDKDNYRVAAFCTGGGKDQFTCLLHNDWGGKKPWRLALDTENMVLGIVDNSKGTVYIYK